mmetsp:Transcript_20372/g.32851  ORF Transcript_20372/g.32851 Transcript_20372/m.32851 type:complete len:183 (+) Transcript_20372:74-622(+)
MATTEATGKALSVTPLEKGDETTFAADGDVVEAFYRGTLAANGELFHTNIGGDPLVFTVGDGSMIEGWDTAIREVSLGGKARVFVPAKRAYGEDGYPSEDGEGYAIPPNSDLVYELEVTKITKAKTVSAPKKLTREEQEAADKERLRLWMEQMATPSSAEKDSKKTKPKTNNKKKGKKKGKK